MTKAEANRQQWHAANVKVVDEPAEKLVFNMHAANFLNCTSFVSPNPQNKIQLTLINNQSKSFFIISKTHCTQK